jgi:hypothetical protein
MITLLERSSFTDPISTDYSYPRKIAAPSLDPVDLQAIERSSEITDKPYDSSSDHLIPAIYELFYFRKSAKQRKQKVQSDISQAA